MAGALARWRPWVSIAGTIAISVTVVAMEAGARRRVDLDGGVDDGEGMDDRRIGGRRQAEAHHLQEPLVDDRALVQRRAAIAHVIRDRRVGIARLGKTDVVGVAGERPVGRDSPARKAALPVI